MSNLLKLILLLVIFTTVTSTYFNWTNIRPIEGDEETIADYTNLELLWFTNNETSICYVAGNFTFNDKFNRYDSSYNHYHIEYYILNKIIYPGRIIQSGTAGNSNVCLFFDRIFKRTMLPMTHNHNDFTPKGKSICPIEARTYTIYEIDRLSQLNSPSSLPEGEHAIQVIFFKDFKNVGGFEGIFHSSSEKLG